MDWFVEDIRDRICDYICDGVVRGRSRLLAFAVMPNHIHLVLRQGELELSRTMHPVLHRTSLLVRAHHSLEGHVFERRYRDKVCEQPDYVRNAIAYTNLNPLKKGLCSADQPYPWCSYRVYREPGSNGLKEIERLVARDDGLQYFTGAHDLVRLHPSPRESVDRVGVPMWKVIAQGPAGNEPSCLEIVRTRSRTRGVSELRAWCVRELITAGFKTGQIARYLNVSAAVVSQHRRKLECGKGMAERAIA